MKNATSTESAEIAVTPEQAERMLQIGRENDGLDNAIASAMRYAEGRHGALLTQRRAWWDEVLGAKSRSEKWFYDEEKKVVYRDGSRPHAKRAP